MSSTKDGVSVHNVLRIVVTEGPIRTTAAGICTDNFMKFVRAVFEIGGRTNRHADTLVAIFRIPPATTCNTILYAL